MKKIVTVAIALSLSILLGRETGADTRGIEHGLRYDRLIIRNVVIVDGKGTPARGPVDIVIRGNIIDSIRRTRSDDEAYGDEAHILDGKGLTLLPGLINMHAHIHDRRGRGTLPEDYIYKLWLGCGITTVRDCGSNYERTVEDRRKSREGQIVAPRIILYMITRGRTTEEIRQKVRDIKTAGGDGVKIVGHDRDLIEALIDEAKKQGLRVAHHIGVEETDAWDDAEFGVTTIEHWYGIPDAALHGSQNFPSWYNYSNEGDRFRYAGRLWREADPDKLEAVLRKMVDSGVAWNTTLVAYENNRDIVRAKNLPWFEDYLHPLLVDHFKPDPRVHGSYNWNWTTTDEVFWRENYKLWMKAVRDFADLGGIVCVGEDSGYSFNLYGFGVLRELELHHEAGFHPIDVIQHATGNNAKVLGMDDRLGRIRTGYLADMILVDGNPLENLKYLYPRGILDLYEIQGDEMVVKGGIQWTIKDGFVYHAPTLLEEVKAMVAEAKQLR
jgi:imidazolonepropionase-like amidohydrolase